MSSRFRSYTTDIPLRQQEHFSAPPMQLRLQHLAWNLSEGSINIPVRLLTKMAIGKSIRTRSVQVYLVCSGHLSITVVSVLVLQHSSITHRHRPWLGYGMLTSIFCHLYSGVHSFRHAHCKFTKGDNPPKINWQQNWSTVVSWNHDNGTPWWLFQWKTDTQSYQGQVWQSVGRNMNKKAFSTERLNKSRIKTPYQCCSRKRAFFWQPSIYNTRLQMPPSSQDIGHA